MKKRALADHCPLCGRHRCSHDAALLFDLMQLEDRIDRLISHVANGRGLEVADTLLKLAKRKRITPKEPTMSELDGLDGKMVI
jgi:hypothetical protein